RTIGDACAAIFEPLMDRDHRLVSYLPLCHAAEQGITNFTGLVMGGETYFCRDLTEIKAFLLEAHPTLFLAVPRVWEKFEAALRGRMAEAKGVKAKLAAWALETELAAFKEEQRTGRKVDSFSRKIANKLVI